MHTDDTDKARIMGVIAPADYAQLFRLLDDYARVQHHAFLAELFLNETKSEYCSCFRPLGGDESSPDRYASRYLQIAMAEVAIVVEKKVLTATLILELDRELAALKY